MKKTYYLLLLTAIVFGACKKSTETEKQSDIQTNTALFLDTFRVYSSDLEGNGLKVLLDEDEKSGNNYIAQIGFSQSNKFVYAYKPASGNMQIKVANANGTNKKTLKTVSENVSIGFLSSFGNKILYMTHDYSNTSSPTPVTEIRSMDEDGSNDTKLNIPQPHLVAKNGSTYINTSSDYSGTTPSSTMYVVKFKNGQWDEASSFTLPKINVVLRETAISNDGNTLVYATSADYSSLTYDFYVLDISTKDNTAKKVLSHTFPNSGDGAVAYPPMLSLAFTNGAANVLVGYGVNVDNQRYATQNDYYYIQNIDVAKETIVKKWKIAGEYGGNLISN